MVAVAGRVVLAGLAAWMAVPAEAQEAPTLAFPSANIARLQALVREDPVARNDWATVRAAADQAIAKPPSDERKIDPALEALALSYRMTGDRRYASAARTLLLARASKPDWLTDLPLARREPRWNSDLGMGTAVASFGLAYDAIRETLSADDRRTLTQGLVRGGIQPILDDWLGGPQRIHTLDTMGHNWWAHIVFSAGIGALAILRDEPRAAAWAARIDQASAEWMEFEGTRIESKPPTFGADGAYSETVGYADLALHSLLMFRRSWQEAMHRPPTPLPKLANVGAYFLANVYPRANGPWVSLDFGDSRPTTCGCRTLADLWILGDRNPDYLRYIAGYGVDPAKDTWREAFNLPFLPEAKVRPAAGSPITAPTASIFPSQGLLTLRDGWKPDATMFAMKSGFTWNHNHADAGSFILQHRGKILLADSGHSAYGTKEYDGYYRQSVAHNVVTIDGKAIPPTDTYDGSHAMGTIDHLIDAPGFRYAWADLTGPTSRYFERNYRNFLWVGDTMLVIDDVRSWESGQFDWLLHYNGTAMRTGQVVRVADGDAAVDVRPLFPHPLPDAGLPTDYPEAMRLVEHTGMLDSDPLAPATYLGFQPAQKADRTKFIVALQPVQPNQPTSRIERLEGLDWIGVRFTGGGKVTEIYLNLLADGRVRHRNANTTLGGFDTDAYLLGLTWPEGRDRTQPPSEMFVANGSYVRQGGRVLVNALSKFFAHFPLDAAGPLSLSAEAHAHVELACAGPLTLTGSGRAIPCKDGTASIPPEDRR